LLENCIEDEEFIILLKNVAQSERLIYRPQKFKRVKNNINFIHSYHWRRK